MYGKLSRLLSISKTINRMNKYKKYKSTHSRFLKIVLIKVFKNLCHNMKLWTLIPEYKFGRCDIIQELKTITTYSKFQAIYLYAYEWNAATVKLFVYGHEIGFCILMMIPCDINLSKWEDRCDVVMCIIKYTNITLGLLQFSWMRTVSCGI